MTRPESLFSPSICTIIQNKDLMLYLICVYPLALQTYTDAAGSEYGSAKDAASHYVEAGKEKVADMYETTTEVRTSCQNHRGSMTIHSRCTR